MAYTPTNWVNDSAPAINATNLNKIETGIDDAHDDLDAATEAATAGELIRRDGSGRAKVATPSATGDIATKGYVDGLSSNYATAAQGSLADSAVQPSDTASTSASGVVELATDAEAIAGSDTSRAVTPAALFAARRQSINAQTGTTYTPVLSDENKLVTLTNAGAITVTLPQDSSLAFPVGGVVDFAILGAGMATFSAGSGASVVATPSAVTLDQYSGVRVQKIAADTWWVVGRLETP